MRVLHIISDRNIGGAGILLLNLLRHFDRLRVESTVAAPQGSALIERIETLGVPVRELKFPCDRLSANSVWEIGELIARERVDLVHANAAFSGRIAGRSRGVRVVHTRHCCFPHEGLLKSRSVRMGVGVPNRWLSDLVIASAEAAAKDLRELGIPNRKLRVIINGSDPVRAVRAQELEAFRRRWDLTDRDFCVGNCARLVPCKGQALFLRAARVMCDRMPSRRFRFLIAGEGPEREGLERLAEQLDLTNEVRFLGFLEDPAPFYRLLRVHVNCSTGTETSCLAISEGMSVGIPTVAGDYGGNPAMLGTENAGILYPTGDWSALADAVCRIACDEALELAMRQAAHTRYQNHFTAARMTEEVMQAYESLF